MEERLEVVRQQMAKQQEAIDNMDRMSQMLQQKSDSLDVFTREIRASLATMNEKLMTNIESIKWDFKDTMKQTMHDIKVMELEVHKSSQKQQEDFEKLESLEKIASG